MSSFNELDVTCENCGEEFKGTVWTAVHAGQDPELKGILLGGELNLLMCPKCSHVSYHDHFILYQDPEAELVAYIYPPSQERDAEFLAKTMRTNFKEAQTLYKPKDRKDYDPILVFGLETFVEMMQEEEARAEQSQIAQAVCKENGIPVALLRPSYARRLGVMRVFPLGVEAKMPTRKEIMEGVRKLLVLNPALERYIRLMKEIESDPKWNLRLEDVKSEMV